MAIFNSKLLVYQSVLAFTNSAGFFDGQRRNNVAHLDFLPLLVAERCVLANELRLQIQFLRVFWTVATMVRSPTVRFPPIQFISRCDHADRKTMVSLGKWSTRGILFMICFPHLCINLPQGIQFVLCLDMTWCATGSYCEYHTLTSLSQAMILANKWPGGGNICDA